MDEENRILTMAGIAMQSAGTGRTIRGAKRRHRHGCGRSEDPAEDNGGCARGGRVLKLGA